MELIRELIRVLYHLDLFRRHVRSGHSVNLHGIKELFSTLSDAMRNPSIQPQTLTNILQTSVLLHELEEKSSADAYNIVASTLLQDFTVFSTNYSLTKVCLSCSTCSHEDSVVKFLHHVDSSLLSSSDYPSFEFSLKTSLNTNEFCQRINCFGELKIFRVLKHEPSILVLDFEQSTSLSALPPLLKPYLVFNSTSSSELYLTSVLLTQPPATLFYHTRLYTWIYTSGESIVSLNTSDWAGVLLEPLLAGNSVGLAFYTYCCPVELTAANSPMMTHHGDAIYDTTNAVPCSSTSTINIPPARCPSSSSLAIAPTLASSPINSTSSPCPSYLHEERIYENWPLDNDSGHGSIEPNNSISSSVEYGTSSGSSSGSSSSASSRTSASTAISNNIHGGGGGGSGSGVGPNKISIYASSKKSIVSSCPPPNGIMNYATIKRRRRAKLTHGLTSVSVPDLTLDFKKVVSFNCKVTLVDDCDDEEYIPHPIFQKVLEKMRNQK